MKALVFNLTPRRWALCKALGFCSPRVFYGPLSALRLSELPEPTLPGPGWARLKTILGGICGTDLALVAHRMHPATILQNFVRFPATLGHENVAVIEAIGGEVPAEWRVGRRVCVEPAVGCHAYAAPVPCSHCVAGRPSLCEHGSNGHLPHRVILGLNPVTGGSWAERFVAHYSQLHAVPDSLSDETAVLVDAVSSAAHAVLRRPPLSGESVLVNGAGTVGLGVMLSIRASGHKNAVTAVVRHPYQEELAKRAGANSVIGVPRNMKAAVRYAAIARACGGRALPGRFGSADLLGGFDLTFDCAGTGVGLSDAIKWTRARGTVVAVGTSGIAVLDTTSLWFNELSVVGAHGRQVERVDGRDIHTYDLVMEWLRSGRIDPSVLPVRRYRLADYRAAFGDLLAGRSRMVLKAAFEP
jgi:threonine dehydrogenase-like Zn-dependent dehydrogenase